MKTFVTSDLHFYHKSILKFCPITRQFSDVEEMNSWMINEWNSKVSSEDTTYILGDFSFSSANKAVEILKQLNGFKILISGNHDSGLLRKDYFRSEFVSIHNLLHLKYNGHRIVMCHYPILDWKDCQHGSFHLHGHLHGTPTGLEKYRVKDVGFDSTGKIVSLLDDVIESLIVHDIKSHY